MAILGNFFHRVPRRGETWWGAKVRRWRWEESRQEEESRHKHTRILHQCCLTDASLHCVPAVTLSSPSLPCHHWTNSRHEKKTNIFYHWYTDIPAEILFFTITHYSIRIFETICEFLFLSWFFLFIFCSWKIVAPPSKWHHHNRRYDLASEQSVASDVTQPTQRLVTVRSDNMSTYEPKCTSRALKNDFTLKCTDGCNVCPSLMLVCK